MNYNEYLKAKLISLPERWNSYCYVVETEKSSPPYKTVYFTESAPGKPIGIPLGTEGFVIYKNPGIFYWQSKQPENKVINDFLEEENIKNWFAL